MATSKKHYLQSKAAQFRKEKPGLHFYCRVLLSAMSKYIKDTGAPEVGANGRGVYELKRG
jgi:hypothetical protein